MNDCYIFLALSRLIRRRTAFRVGGCRIKHADQQEERVWNIYKVYLLLSQIFQDPDIVIQAEVGGHCSII